MIRPIGVLAPKTYFKGQSGNYENPANREMKEKLALVNAFGVSAVAGAVTTAVSRGIVSSWKHAGGIGAITGALTMMFLAPMFLYKAGFKTFKKESAQEKDMQKKIIADMNNAIDSRSNSLSGKLDNYSKTLIRKVA